MCCLKQCIENRLKEVYCQLLKVSLLKISCSENIKDGGGQLCTVLLLSLTLSHDLRCICYKLEQHVEQSNEMQGLMDVV